MRADSDAALGNADASGTEIHGRHWNLPPRVRHNPVALASRSPSLVVALIVVNNLAEWWTPDWLLKMAENPHLSTVLLESCWRECQEFRRGGL